MELQALLVLCGAGVAVLAVLLLAGLFSTAGTSYEEAVAQQRRATTELLALASNKNKPKKSKKANKKLAKKEKKENASVTTASEPDSEAPAESGVEEELLAPASVRPHVEFSPPVIVDIPRDSPPHVKQSEAEAVGALKTPKRTIGIRKRGKDPKIKPILVNKEDPSCISDPSTPPSPTDSVSNHFEEIHPKDEFELLHSSHNVEKIAEKKEEVTEKKENKAIKLPKSGKAVTKTAPILEAPKEDVVTRERQHSGDAPKEQRKVKKGEKRGQNEEVVEALREEVVPPLNTPQPSELTTEKLLKQAMVTTTLQSSPPSTGNKGKKNKKPEPNVLSLMAGDIGGVNVGELVRLVNEAALSRTEIQILTDVLLNKHHDPLPQHSEWSEGPNDPMQKLKKQLADKEKALADEVEASQALHAKLKELRASLNAERARAAAAGRAADDGAAAQRAELHALQARLQRLLDDNHALAQEKLMLQSKLTAEGDVQAQRVQMEMHIQRLSEGEAALMQQLGALQAEASARALELAQARCEAGAARDSLLLTQQHAGDLAQQLQEANRVCGELDGQRQGALHAEQLAQKELRQLQERVNGISELQAEIQKLKMSVQKAESTVEKAKEEAENQKHQLESELSSLRQQIAARESELAELKQLKTHAQNGLPPSAANDQLKANELAKVESIMESLRSELAAAQRSSSEHKDQVAKLSEQVKQYQDKNNELRTKNWKVMEALQSAEKALQSKSASVLRARDSVCETTQKVQEAQYNEVAEILKSACPNAAPSTIPGRAWLESFAANLKKELAKLVQAKASAPEIKYDNSRVEDLTAQNEQLQNAVDRYKRIIDDTEGVLSRLQTNVTEEEQRWAKQIADMQRQIDELSHRDSQSQKKIDSLELQLRQANESNGKSSFSESERLTEENTRLMAGLTDKHKLDSYNGPLKLGLEEI